MANKAVFLDRDNTLIEDPGYLSDPAAVRLLPGVDLAIKSLAQCGYKTVVVTNQSGIARGLLTEEALERIHGEMRRQLAERGAHLDAIYYCPFHPEGTVEQYAKDSDLRKPKPGMLLKAAKDLDIDLSASWLVGDGARDIEAGQRAGCRTVRVRTKPSQRMMPGEESDESVQADHTVRNLVDAARVILRAPQPSRAVAATEAAKVIAAKEPVETEAVGGLEAGEGAAAAPVAPVVPPKAAPAPSPPPAAEAGKEPTTDSEVLREILRHIRQLARSAEVEEFSFTKLIGAIIQVLVLLVLLIVFVQMLRDETQAAMLWAAIGGVLQVMVLSLFLVRRSR